jgi:hypothetical protein
MSLRTHYVPDMRKMKMPFGHVRGANLPWKTEHRAVIGPYQLVITKAWRGGWFWTIADQWMGNDHHRTRRVYAAGSATSCKEAKLRASVSLENILQSLPKSLSP